MSERGSPSSKEEFIAVHRVQTIATQPRCCSRRAAATFQAVERTTASIQDQSRLIIRSGATYCRTFCFPMPSSWGCKYTHFVAG